ncbi:serine/threonine protein kinase, partial [Candidatus Poribacteria bacterium]|nr:serine/threonine protein kinase [Candidatus Poribacteria bacterium]
AKTIDFSWETDVWYTMKMMVEVLDDKAVIRGKVWRRDEPEPAEWTITAEDPLPNREGSPGIYGYSATELYYDNLKVW